MKREGPSGKENTMVKSGERQILRLHLLYITSIVLILLAVVFSMAIKNKSEKLVAAKKAEHVEQKQLVNAILLELHPESIDDKINLPGTVEAWTSLNLLAKISGAVTEVLVQEGDKVLAGQPLARIEADDYRIARDAADAAYRLALSEYERSQAMIKKKVISPANLETAETNLLTAKAELARAKLQLSRTEITAPIGGFVNRLDVKIGVYLSVGDPVGQILDIDRVKAVVGIPESDVDAVRRVESVNLTIDALQSRQIQGKTHFLSTAPESNALLYRLELQIANSDNQILPGMFIRAHVVKRHIEDAIMVPLYSIVTRGEDQFVYVEKDGMVHRRHVEVGVIDKWQVQIVSGLEAGEKVVIEGQRDVEDGQKIHVVKTVTDPSQGVL
ncbi:efflux RND transporter periplasmic adaptor subunit [Desulfogranum japonicum]|uniref:efflux RND transporter periplasmic adaptor subunit n=1 Tax=Desulfogranum japonicum TaxID=231447 RepID=UPI0004900A6E|nr:efflux RND transporter periplasmic adaptor subunit [Desulfogranum japonicum]